jgi:prepilin-type N-terminal cleavage/methylation domain-containing protein
MHRPPTRRAGFTLIEILIVVVILGILAVIVIPQVAGASVEAVKASLKSQLKIISDNVEVYRVNNAGRLPVDDPTLPLGAAGSWGVLVSESYMKEPPYNSYTGGTVVGGGTTAAAAAAAPKGHAIGWQYAFTATRLDVWASGYDLVTDRLSNEP